MIVNKAFPINQLRELNFRGSANGVNLLKEFDENSLIGKYLLIKKIKTRYYFPFGGLPGPNAFPVEFANDTISLVPSASARYLIYTGNQEIDVKKFSYDSTGAIFKLTINNNLLDIWNRNIPTYVSPEQNLEDIFTFYPEKITNQGINISADVTLNLPANLNGNFSGGASNSFVPNIKFTLDVYLLGQLDEIKSLTFVEPKDFPQPKIAEDKFNDFNHGKYGYYK